MLIKTKTAPALFAVLILILCSAGCFAFSFENEVIESDLTSFKWCFDNIYEADTPMYKDLLVPYVSPNNGCEDANIKVIAEEPIIYNQEICTSKTKEECVITLIKGDSKNGTVDKNTTTCTTVPDGQTCVLKTTTIIEQYDLKKTDYLLSDKTRLCVYGTRKAKTGFQSCDMNFNYNDPIKPFNAEALGKLWWNNSYTHKFNINCSFVPDGTPIIINGSNGIMIGGTRQLIWTTCYGTGMALYLKNATDVYDYQVANDTNRMPQEIEEGTGQNYNAPTIWTGHTNVYHMKNLSDSVTMYNLATDGSPTNVGALISNGSRIDATGEHIKNITTIGITTNISFGGWFKMQGAGGYVGGSVHSIALGSAWSAGNILLRTKASPSNVLDVVDPFSGDCTLGGTWTMPYDVWYHIMVTIDYSTNNGYLYINGKLNDTTADCSRDNYQIPYYFSGGSPTTLEAHWFNGTYDEMRYYSGLLSATTVNVTYQNTIPTAGYGNAEALSQNVISTDLEAGILNTSWQNITSLVVMEGQEFLPYANYTYETNHSSVTNTSGSCKFNLSNVSVEYYNNSDTNASLCAGGACSYENKTNTWNADTSVFNVDVLRFSLCRNSAATPDAYIAQSCVGGTTYTSNIPSNTVPLCSAGHANFTYTTTGCVGASSTVNVSIWTTGNTLAKGYTLYRGGQVGFDRYRDETNKDMVWNNTMNLWHSALWYEYYQHGSITMMVWCYDASTIENQSIGVTFIVQNRAPSLLFSGLYDWLNGRKDFIIDTEMYYPLVGTLNTSVFCLDDDLQFSSINLTFENGTVIYGHTSTGSPGFLAWNQSNFSTNAAYLNGSLGYRIYTLCNDTTNNVTVGNRRFYATNQKPTSSWLNVSGGLYSYAPTFSYSCVDREGIAMTGYVVFNGTTMATNSPVNNGSSVSYNTAGFGAGNWTIGIICGDAYANSTNTTITWTYNTACVLNLTGLKDNTRYIDTEQTVNLGCTNALSITSCFYTINGYAAITPNNCSLFNISLEQGNNRLVFNYTANGVESSSTLYNVWAKKNQTGFASYMVLIVLLMACVLLIVLHARKSIPVFGVLACIGIFLVGYYVIAFSLLAAILVWCIAVVLLLYIIFG